jgi:hypothetical protein
LDVGQLNLHNTWMFDNLVKLLDVVLSAWMS